MPLLNDQPRKLRESSGRKRREFAAKVGISYKHLVNIERSVRPPSIEVANRIANELGVDVDDILANDDSTERAS